MKMGRASGKPKIGKTDSMDVASSSSSEGDDESEGEETPDLYRNSSLGM